MVRSLATRSKVYGRRPVLLAAIEWGWRRGSFGNREGRERKRLSLVNLESWLTIQLNLSRRINLQYI